MQDLGKTEKKRGRPATGRDPSVTIRIPSPLLAWINEQAEQYEIGRSDMIRRLIEESRIMGLTYSKGILRQDPDSRLPGELRKTRTAYHEAGHAVVARIFGVSLNRVTIEHESDTLGHVAHEGKWRLELRWQRRKTHDWREAWYASMMINMAGREAESEILRVGPDGGDRSDRKQARQSSRDVVGAPYGWSSLAKPEIENVERKLRLVTQQTVGYGVKCSIKGVADALLSSETIDQKRVDQIIARHGELSQARRLVMRCWRDAGLISKTRRVRGAPKRRGNDHC
jgi:peptidase M41-like protein